MSVGGGGGGRETWDEVRDDELMILFCNTRRRQNKIPSCRKLWDYHGFIVMVVAAGQLMRDYFITKIIIVVHRGVLIMLVVKVLRLWVPKKPCGIIWGCLQLLLLLHWQWNWGHNWKYQIVHYLISLLHHWRRCCCGSWNTMNNIVVLNEIRITGNQWVEALEIRVWNVGEGAGGCRWG